MYTRCSTCHSQFRIRAAQLCAARGYVRCGACGHSFDALASLTDTRQPSVTSMADAEPQFTIPGTAGLRARHDDSDVPELPAGMHGMETEEESMGEMLRDPDIDRNRSLDAEDWRDEPAPSRRGWWIAATILLLAGILQASWFNRDRIYEHYPQSVSWVTLLCQQLGCEVYRQRSPQSIELIDRDVRTHPGYADMLLINATIANRSGRRQPYPTIELALYDTSGRVTAYRRFDPQDYMDASLPIAAGMPPDAPLHLVLEVSAEGHDAVSFEFGFL